MQACPMVDVPKHTRQAVRVFLFDDGVLHPIGPIFEDSEEGIRDAQAFCLKLMQQHNEPCAYSVRHCRVYVN